jgi:hypothetical protein
MSAQDDATAVNPGRPGGLAAARRTAGGSCRTSRLALFGVGAAVGLINGRPALRAGARQLIVGGAAALIVFGIGDSGASGKRVD